MPEILPRAIWTPSAEGFTRFLSPLAVKNLYLHYPADGNVIRAGQPQEVFEQLLRGYRRYHMEVRGWPDIGYNFSIDQDGRVYSAAGYNKVAAHSASKANPSANKVGVGCVLLIGNTEKPTEQMIYSINSLYADLKNRYYPNMTTILGHRQVYGAQTSCPGDAVIELISTGRIHTGSVVVPPPVITPDLDKDYDRNNYTPAQITNIQTILKRSGYYLGNLTGKYGYWTYNAVKHYQASQVWPNLVEDGDWGPATQNHYDFTVRLQTTLNEWKSDYPDLIIDGDFGNLTKRRVEEWQRRNHGGAYPRSAAIDGIPGPLTCKALGIPNHP